MDLIAEAILDVENKAKTVVPYDSLTLQKDKREYWNHGWNLETARVIYSDAPDKQNNWKYLRPEKFHFV